MINHFSRRIAQCLATMAFGLSAIAVNAGDVVSITTLNERLTPISVDVPVDPKRVAVIDMAILDIMDQWQLTDRIVAMPQTTPVPHLKQYFEKSDRITNIGTLKEVDFEGLMASEPEVIFISGRLQKKYQDLSKIAPVVYLTTDRSIGTMKSFEKNLMEVAKIFEKTEEAKKTVDQFKARVDRIRQASQGKTALVGLVTSAHVNLLGNQARGSLIGNEFGFENIAQKANANHGNEASFELLLKLNPDYFFVLDRDSAIARPGAKLAKDILNNSMVNKMQAKINNHIVYLTPAAWYLSEGGITAMDLMFKDIESALGLPSAVQ